MLSRNCALMVLMVGLAYSSAAAAQTAPSATDILQKSDVPRPKDQITTMTIAMRNGGVDRKLVFRMAWQSLTKGPYAERVLMFGEYPPDQKGIAYMAFLRPVGTPAEDDAWLYLPELRTVRRVSQRDEKHAHDDLFGNSVLKTVHLRARDTSRDTHRLLAPQVLNGESVYVVESVPPDNDTKFPFGKVVRYVAQDSYLMRRTEFYNLAEQLQIVMDVTWRQYGQAWAWERVFGTNVITGDQTEFTFMEDKVDSGLDESLFSKRTMQLGARLLQ